MVINCVKAIYPLFQKKVQKNLLIWNELHFFFLGLYRLVESMPIVTKTAFFHLAERIQESWPELIGNHEAHLEAAAIV